MARLQRVVLVEVAGPYGIVASWGGVIPGFEVSCHQVSVGRVIDIEDVEWLWVGGYGDGGNKGGWDWDLLEMARVNVCVNKNKGVGRVVIIHWLCRIVSAPFGGGNAQSCVGINIGFLYKYNIKFSRVDVFDETKQDVSRCLAVLLDYVDGGVWHLRH